MKNPSVNLRKGIFSGGIKALVRRMLPPILVVAARNVLRLVAMT